MLRPLPRADSQTVWQFYSASFSVRLGTASISVYGLIDRVGWIESDDYSIVSYTHVGFTRPLVSITFDDGYGETVDNALPILNQHGLKSSHCYPVRMTIDRYMCHSLLHLNYTSYSIMLY